MQRNELLYLNEMASAIRKIVDVCTTNDFQIVHEWNHILIDSLLWNYTVLGEAANKLPASLIEQYPDVEWRQAVALRNRVVHGYWSVDLDILVEVAIHNLPKMLDDIEKIIKSIRKVGS